MLRQLLDEWEVHHFDYHMSSNNAAVLWLVARVNQWKDVNLGGVTSSGSRIGIDPFSHDYRPHAHDALHWYETGVDPRRLPVGWRPGPGDIRVVWKNLKDPSKSGIIVPGPAWKDPGTGFRMYEQRDMLTAFAQDCACRVRRLP